jgi:signal transduction protein with GAF and PtsI domain
VGTAGQRTERPLAVGSPAVRELGSGAKVFDHGPVQGTLRVLAGPDDVLELMDTGAEGIIALVRDAGATFLAPVYHELTGVICTSGTVRSHIGIVSREFQVPCIMGASFPDGEPADGTAVELDCSGDTGVLRAG